MAATTEVARSRDANDEPNEDWTIEEVLNWCLEQSSQKTNRKRDEIVRALQQQFEASKAELWTAHEQAQAAVNETGDDANNTGGAADENNDGNAENAAATRRVAAKKESGKTAGKSRSPEVHVEVLSGPHAGSSFTLKPRSRSPCYVGRSAGKKFREKGISLHGDSEVSTTHGKFELKAGKIYFTDMGSTNGTVLNEEELEESVQYEVNDGDQFLVGVTSLRIKLS